MATEPISFDHASGRTLYAVVWYQSTYFDWTDNALETPSAGSDAQAVLAMTEYALDGNATSHYATSAINLATLWNYLTAREFVVRIYDQQGGSPDLTADPVIKSLPLKVALGRNNPVLDVQAIAGFRKDENPQVASFWLTVTADCEPIDLTTISGTAPTVVVTARKEAAASDLLTSGTVALNAAGQFYVTFATPQYTADRTYLANINVDSGTLIRQLPFLAAG